MKGAAAHLRSQLLAKGEERQVEVNQRHLIDKILARYSSEFTLFRELIQNANDAGATHIEIVLTSLTYRPPSADSSSSSSSSSAPTVSQLPASSASSAASSILNIFKFGSWATSAEKEQQKEAITNAVQSVNTVQFGTCDATEIKIQNNGRAFTEEDWTRIRKIAEGNPNTESCGMFGVGFYSVFAICENPIIKSGDDCLIFHWRGDMLVTTRAKVEEEADLSEAEKAERVEKKDWVAFVLEAREIMPFDLDQLSRFVVKSISFTTNVQSISLIINDTKILQVHTNGTKDNSQPAEKEVEEIAVPVVTKEDVKKRPKEHGCMSIASITAQRMTVRVDRYPFTKPLFVKMRLLSAQVNAHWEFFPSYYENMQRILKKNPPHRTNILLLYNFDEEDDAKSRNDKISVRAAEERASTNRAAFWSSLVAPSSASAYNEAAAENKIDDLIVDLYPSPQNGHIFIGFSTQQTTGTGFHLAAQLIPTVERENIDFQDVYISNWNCNLLAAAGQVSRLYYDHVMKKLESADVQNSEIEHELVSLLSAHSFSPSHPSEKVVRLLNQYFFVHPLQYANAQLSQQIPPTQFLVPSTAGVCTCDKVRLPNLDMEDFLIENTKGNSAVTIIPKTMLKKCDRFFSHLKARKMIREISFDDLLANFKARDHTLSDLSRIIRWFCKPQVELALFSGSHERKNIAQLLSCLTVVVETKEQPAASEGEVSDQQTSAPAYIRQNLGEVRYFVASRSMRSLPLPPATLNPIISTSLGDLLPKPLRKRWGWRELTPWDWWTHIRNNLSLLSQKGGVELLQFIADFFPQLPAENRAEIIATLRQVPCIPVEPKEGVQSVAYRRPEEIYFPNVKLFSDIDHVRSDFLRHDTTPFLKALGVRDTIDLKLVLGRLEQLRWNIKDLIEYLVQQQASFTSADWNLLRNSAFLPAVMFKRVNKKAETPKESNDENAAEQKADGSNVTESTLEPVRSSQPRRARDLFFPSEELKALGFIVLDWPEDSTLDPKSKSAQLLTKVGLLNKPDLVSLIQMAAAYPLDENTQSENEQMREKILSYMEHNAEELLYHQPAGFRLLDVNARFIPALVNVSNAESGKTEQRVMLSEPGRCFLNTSPFEFPVVVERWRHLAKKLQIAADPPLSAIINIVVNSPPSTQARGQEVFEYLYTRMQELTREDRKKLLSTPFIPLTFGRTKPRMSSVHEVFITDCFQHHQAIELKGEAIKRTKEEITNIRKAMQELEGKKSGMAQSAEEKLRAKLARTDQRASAQAFQQQQSLQFQMQMLQDQERKASKVIKQLTQEIETLEKEHLQRDQVSSSKQSSMSVKRPAFEVFDNLLDFVDFGEKGNLFLRNCGVEEYPSPEQFAYNIMRHHERYLAKNGLSNYLKLLSLFSAAFPHIVAPTPSAAQTPTSLASSAAFGILDQLRQCPFCIGLQYTDTSSSADRKKMEEAEEGEKEAAKEVAFLSKAADCYLIDNERLAKLFNPPRIPHSSGDAGFSSANLERMYESLGSKWITSDIKTSVAKLGAVVKSENAQALRLLLTERKSLLLNNMNGKRRKNLRLNAEEVLDRLNILSVDKIQRVLTFKDQSVKEEAGVAVMTHEGKLALFIVENMELDYFDIGTELVGLLYRKSAHDDALLTAMLLQTPLPTLRKRGWPVDRLLQKAAAAQVSDATFQAIVSPRQSQEGMPPQRQGTSAALTVRESASTPPKVGEGGGPVTPRMEKTIAQPQKKAGFLQSIWDAFAAPPAPPTTGARPGVPAPDTRVQPPSVAASAGNGRGVPPQAPQAGGQSASVTRGQQGAEAPKSSVSGSTNITSQVKIDDSPLDAKRMYQHMESEASRALQRLNAGSTQLIHQQAGERREVNYHCEVLPEQTLIKIDEVGGVTLYLEEGSTLGPYHMEGAKEMGQVLLQLAALFGIPAGSVNLWVGEKGRRIAFNRGRSLFFNLAVYMDLHFQRRLPETISYWYMVMCHELAHNNVSAHNEEHENLMSWLAFRNLEPLYALMQQHRPSSSSSTSADRT